MTYLLIVVAFAFFGTYIYIDNKIEITNYAQKFSVPEVKTLSEEEIASERLKMLPAIKKNANVTEEKAAEVVFPITEEEAYSKITAEDASEENEFVAVQPLEMYVTYEDGQSATLLSVENDQIKPYLSTSADYTITSTNSNADTIYKSFSGSVLNIENNRLVLSSSNDGSYFFIDKKGDFKVYLNGKRIILSNISVGDKVSFEGQVKTNLNTAVTGTIIITGYSQLLTM